MVLKDSIKSFARFIGILQPDPYAPSMYDQSGYAPDDGGYYQGQQYDPNGYDGGQYGGGYGGAQGGGQYGGYGGTPMQPSQQGSRGGYADDGYAPPRSPMGGQTTQSFQQPFAPQQPPQQPFSPFGNNQRSKQPPNNVVQMPRPEDGGAARGSNKHSEIIVCVRGMDDCQEIINALLESKSVFINMEPMDDLLAQRVIDVLCGASFALRGTMAKISHRTYLLAPNSVDVVNSQTPGPGPSFRSEFSALRK